MNEFQKEIIAFLHKGLDEVRKCREAWVNERESTRKIFDEAHKGRATPLDGFKTNEKTE